MKDKINDNMKVIRIVLCAFLLLISSFNLYISYNEERFPRLAEITGAASSGSGIAGFYLLKVADTSNNYRRRVFYEDGSVINLSVFGEGIIDGLRANFSCMDSNYADGAETVTNVGGNNYTISYTISQSNTVTNVNNSEDPTCPVGEECHRVCTIPITAGIKINATIDLAFYEGKASKNYAWYTGYVTRAANCAAGVSGSNYFLENNTCSSVFYNPADTSYYYGAKDVDFSVKKKNTPDVVETSCANGIDDDSDSKIDCEDSDCASIVYGEYYIVGGSNANKQGTPAWTCNKTTAGWRDDPPYSGAQLDASIQCISGGACDSSCAPNLCTGTASGTSVTYTYEVQPEALFSIRLYQASQVTGYAIYFKAWQFNTSLWQNNPGDFWILNYTDTTSLSGKTTSANSIIAQSGPDPPADPTPYTYSTLDNVLKALMNTTNSFSGLYGLVLNRIFDGSAYDFKFNINISSIGVRDEHDISCSDSYDNDLDYTTDCIDIDCDAYIGSGSANPDGTYPLCAYQNESKYAATNNSCTDGFDNDDDGDTDCHYSAGTWDIDCNNTYILNSSWISNNVGAVNGTCQLGVETICNDEFDNDRDRAFDCNTTAFFTPGSIQYTGNPGNPLQTYSGGPYPNGEYNCFNDSNCLSNETLTDCLDGKDNDLDFYSGLNGAGADCRLIEYDLDCNNTALGAGNCELIFEKNCADSFDNDRDGEYDCVTASTGGSTINPEYRFGTGGGNIADGEYDCQSTCNVTVNWENDGTNCSDNKDNDLDYFTITGWTGTQYTAQNNAYGGGMDCRYNYDGNHYPDADCNGVDMGGWECNLGHEQNCTDGFDNDLDNAYNDGGNRTNSGGYDCDDYDCAYNSACPLTETASLCVDGIDNDLDRYVYNITDYLLDTNRVVNLSGGVDCIYYAYGLTPNQLWPYAIAYDSYRYEPDCNNTAIGPSGQNCELIVERNCTDVFDNDQDYYVSQIQNPGWTSVVYEPYFGAGTFLQDADCNDYSCSGNTACPAYENYTCSHSGCNLTQNWCLDSIDNDLDNYLSDGLNLSSIAGAGIDCAWNNYDTDCNNSYINDSGYVGLCTLRWEFNCSDNVDNDQDLGTYYQGAAGSATAGASTSVDCDDYNCYAVQEASQYVCTDDGSGLSILEQVCNDTLDNDLDAYTWNASGSSYYANDASGTDCGDPDCNGLSGPGNIICALFEEMYFDPFDDTLCGDYNSSGTTAYSQDNDGDSLANCYDSGCYHLGLCRVCPLQENVTLDACMDGLNNEYVYQDAYISTLNYAPGDINASLNDDVYDCRDSDCDGIVGVWSASQGICNSASAGTGYRTTESACTDGYDNDFDNSVDCEDANCAGDSSCLAPYTNNLVSCTLKCSEASAVSYIGGEPPDYSVNTNWGGGTPDLTYTEYHHRGKNFTFTFTDSASNVQGKTLQIYLGSASATYVPLDYEMNASNSGIHGTDSGNFNVQYSAPVGGHYQAVLLEYSGGGAYPNQVLNLTFWITVPDNDQIVTNSSFSYYVSTSVGGVEQNADVTQYILETEPPQAPTFVKTSPADDDYETARLRMIKTDNTVTRLSASDTVLVRVNANDTGTWNSGIELCQFNDGTGWVNETASYDCRYALSLSDGSNTIYARVVDGVGNIGPNTSLTISVTTLPTQLTQFYCLDTNCSISYPTKDYYLPTESLNVAVNFTSTYGFTANATGCLVYAEKQTPGSRVLLDSVHLSAAGVCNGTANLTALSEGYYTVEVQTTDANGSIVVSGELPWSNGNNKESIWICDYVKTYSGYTCKDSCEREAANKPSKVILKSPESGNITIDRTPTFIWHNVTYNGTNEPKYEIEIDDSPTFTSLEYSSSNIAEGSNETNHTITSALDLDKTYFWRVRAYYSIIAGDWSDSWNFTVLSYIAINLTRNDIDFGPVIPGSSADTVNDTPLPFLLENIGNMFVNISINASDMFVVAPNPNESYTFKIGINETGSFNTGASTMTFIPMPPNSTPAIYDFNWNDSSDTAEIDLNVTVPLTEPGGPKNSTVLVQTI